MIRNVDGKLYIGISHQVETRLRAHNAKCGTRFTKNSSNYVLAFKEAHKTLIEARRREIQIKNWRTGLPTKA